MWLRGVIGVVLCGVGTVWVLQGTKVIVGSSMSGEGMWAVIGAIMVVAGLACLAWAFRYRRRLTTSPRSSSTSSPTTTLVPRGGDNHPRIQRPAGESAEERDASSPTTVVDG